MKLARLFLSLLLSLIVFSFSTTTLLAAQLPGAIFTTDSECSGVDLNIYGARVDVYVDGGPAHPGAAGLLDGQYYVKVTEPDGDLLGTSIGTPDETPVVVAGGEFVTCYQLWNILVKASDGTQGYDLSGNPGGEYKVWISTVSTFDNDNTKTDNFKVDEPTGTPGPTPVPTPLPQARLRVEKFYDTNANGVYDSGEALINGWKIRIQDGIDWIRYTLVDMIVAPDTYTVTEFTPIETNWYKTTTNPVVVTLANGNNTLVRFGNVCTGAGGGHTLGYWSNKNGYATMRDGGTEVPELAMLSALNLRTASGANFDPGTYSEFRTWLLNARATNMAYMLSAQLAAMELNVESTAVSGSTLVYAPGLLPYAPIPGLNALGFININDLMTAANTELGAHSLAPAGSPYRAYQEALKNVLDSANNNVNFVQPAPCPFSFAE